MTFTISGDMNGEIQPISVKTHAIGNGTHRLYRFDNGLGASVVQFTLPGLDGMGGSYGSEDGLWELGVIRWTGEENYKLTYETPITDDVLGYLTEDQVQETLRQIRDLPAVES